MARQFRFVRSAGRIPAGATRDLTVGALHSIAAAEGVAPHELGLWTDQGDGIHFTERAAQRQAAQKEATLWETIRRLSRQLGQEIIP